MDCIRLDSAVSRPVGEMQLPPVEGEINRLTRLVRDAIARAGDITSDLSGHADRLHGPVPECESNSVGMPARSGTLGELEDAIDRLHAVLSALNAAAHRNMGLA